MPRADIARERLGEELREAGADVTEVVAYRTLPGEAERGSDYDIYRMLLDRQIDAVTFASASAVRNFVAMIGREQAADLLRTTVVASIGPVTAEAAQQLDIATTVMPEPLHDPRSRRRARRAFRRSHTDLNMATKTHYDVPPGSAIRGARTATRPDFPRHRPRRLRRTPALRGARSRNAAVARDVHLSAVRLHRRRTAARSGLDAGRVSSSPSTRPSARRPPPSADGIPGVLLFGLPDEKDAGRLGRLRSRRRRCRPRRGRSSARCPACWS